jgi:hypothetical protein
VPESDGSTPFTPDGAGTVIDNVHDGDGKEFFTIGTEDGSVFYLIVDRQRNADNVYLLNSVTLDDLVALADKSGQSINTNPNGSTSAVETPGQQAIPGITENSEQNTTSAANSTGPAEEPSEKPPAKSDANMYILIGIIVLAVGGAGYYFKIVKGKKNISDGDGDGEEDNEDIYGYGGDTEYDDNADAESEDGGGGE